MINRFKTPALALVATTVLSGCVGGLLDVDNPNNLVEESIRLEAAANGVVNGSLRLVSAAVADIWEGPAVVADELYWTGSRDAWGQLDNGFIGDPLNEFTDAAFPSLGRGVWMAQNAVDILEEHVSNNPGVDSFARDLHRAQFFNGIVLTVTGESQEDMTFSNKREDSPPVGPGQMFTVLDRAISNLDAAVSGFAALGESDLETAARAVRARAHMSRAIWDELNPTATVGTAISFAAALADANAVITAVGGSDWQYNLNYSAASISCDMCGNVNSRGENQWDQSLVENTGPGASGRTGVVTLLDPVGGEPDLAVATALAQWGGDQYGGGLTIVSERLMRLIVAEDALAGGDTGTFASQINAIRDLEGYVDGAGDPAPYVYAAGNAVEALTHHRRVNTLFMGLRLQDMYRWGLSDPLWQSGSEAVNNAGQMLPITIIECRANSNLDGVTCATVSG